MTPFFLVCLQCGRPCVQSLGWKDTLEKEMAAHSSILPGKSHGRRSLAGYSPLCHKESDMTSDFHFHSCFTILCWFLLYSNVNQLCVCIHRLPPGPPPTPTPSHPPGVTIELQAEPRVLCCRLLVQMSRECS